MSPLDFRRSVTFDVGAIAPQTLTFGGLDREHLGLPWQLARLRIGYSGSVLGSLIRAEISLADGGSVIGPLDLPASIDVEEPPLVSLVPAAAMAATTRIVLSLTQTYALTSPIANWTDGTAAAPSVYPLPQWVRSVSGENGCTYQYRDRAAAVLSVASGALRPRPALAADVIIVAGGAITFWY